MSDSLQPHGLYSPWDSPGQNTGVGDPFPSSGDLPNPGIEPRSPALQPDALPSAPPGKPVHTQLVPCLLLSGFPYSLDHSFSQVGTPSAKVKSAQSCLTLCNPMDYTVHGFPKVRILEWVVFPFSRGSSQPRDQTQVSCIAGGFFTS